MAIKPQHKRFADYWLDSFNGTQSAIKAGYSEKSAYSTASRLLKNAEIQAYIQARLRVQDAMIIASADETMAFLSAVMRGNVKDQFDLDPSLSDRLRAGESLMKRYSALADKTPDIEDFTPLAEALKKARAEE